MKNIITLMVAVATLAIATGCSNKESQAQDLLLEAISYSTGFPDAKTGENAVRLANSHGYTDAGQLTRPELTMIAGQLRCTEIIEQFPNTQAALKAAELRNQINTKLTTIAQARNRAAFE